MVGVQLQKQANIVIYPLCSHNTPVRVPRFRPMAGPGNSAYDEAAARMGEEAQHMGEEVHAASFLVCRPRHMNGHHISF